MQCVGYCVVAQMNIEFSSTHKHSKAIIIAFHGNWESNCVD